jgi:flagellar biosynthesis protein FliR
MTAAFDPTSLVTFMLVMTRLVAAFTVAPPFDGTQLPARIRVGLAVAIAIAVTPNQSGVVPESVPGLVVGLAYQVVVGLAMGFAIRLLLSAVSSAGALIDLAVGYSAAALYDPFSQAAATPLARLYQLMATVFLVVLDGHLLVVHGILRSYEAAPLSGMRIDSLGTVLTEGVGQMLIAALEIAFPVLVALVLADAVLGLVTRAAPRLNVMVLGFAVKSLILLFVLGLALPLVANGVSTLVVRGVRWAVALAGAAG